LPEDHEYQTISGFVTDKLGYIPENISGKPPIVEYENVKLVVLQVKERSIIKIRVIKDHKPADKDK
ncbi:MAG: hypothetical protein K2J80_14250, partial [Oscillospiraceae bacterium]|nr:hypothetical protein [Oscillospiraceae bacterium]